MDEDRMVKREAVGIFPDNAHLLAAIDELEQENFSRRDISVLGNEAEMRKTYNKPYRNPMALEEDPSAPRGVMVAPEEQSLAEAALVAGGIIIGMVASGPILGASGVTESGFMLLLAPAAIGGVIGYGLARMLRQARHRRYQGQERKGGLLLWVNTPTQDREAKAQAILAKHGARDVHVNEVARAVAY